VDESRDGTLVTPANDMKTWGLCISYLHLLHPWRVTSPVCCSSPHWQRNETTQLQLSYSSLASRRQAKRRSLLSNPQQSIHRPSRLCLNISCIMAVSNRNEDSGLLVNRLHIAVTSRSALCYLPLRTRGTPEKGSVCGRSSTWLHGKRSLS
jgi:hypothetical protein